MLRLALPLAGGDLARLMGRSGRRRHRFEIVTAQNDNQKLIAERLGVTWSGKVSQATVTAALSFAIPISVIPPCGAV